MLLFTKPIMSRLLANGHDRDNPETRPVVKLFTPDAQCTWLLSEIDPENPDIAFGLCDMGHGSPELGYVSIAELKALRGGLGLPVERDRCFTADKTLESYADAARDYRSIVA